MVDFLDNELKVGDRVAWIGGRKSNTYLQEAYVVGRTESYLKLSLTLDSDYIFQKIPDKVVKIAPKV